MRAPLSQSALPCTVFVRWPFSRSAVAFHLPVLHACSGDGPAEPNDPSGDPGTFTPAVAPVLSSLEPPSVKVGGEAFEVVVRGEGFHEASVVRRGDEALPTNLVSDSELEAMLAAERITEVGAVEVRVETPPPGGGTSHAHTFEVTAPLPPALHPAPRLGTGSGFNCAVAEESRAYCWGGNGHDRRRVNTLHRMPPGSETLHGAPAWTGTLEYGLVPSTFRSGSEGMSAFLSPSFQLRSGSAG
jgi:hypothetical protein